MWRLVATGISFIIFGVGGVFLTLIVFPVVSLFVRCSVRRKLVIRKIIQLTFRLFLEMMSFFGIFAFDLTGAKNELSRHSGKIIVANHPSLIDIVALIALLPNADCIVKRELWSNPFLRGVVLAAGYIKNSENIEQLFMACESSLQGGSSLIIFPEGTRTKTDGQINMQRGASNIALKCERDLVPVTIRCNPTTLTKNEPWYRIPEQKANFSLSVGGIIEVQAFNEKNQSRSIGARKLTKYIEAYFTEELRNYA